MCQVPHKAKNYSTCPPKSLLLGQMTGVGDMVAILVLSQREDLFCRNWTDIFFHIAKLTV